MLFSSLPLQAKGDGAEDLRIGAYHLALDGVSADAFESVVRDIIRGSLSDFDPRFVPTPPQLARVCRDRMADIWARAEQLRRANEPKLLGDDSLAKFDYVPTAEQAARIDAKIRSFKTRSPKSGTAEQIQQVPWYDRPMKVEEAAEMSPELKRILARNWHIMGVEAP